MSAATVLALAAAMVGTAFLSGVFGMAGGLVLVGVLLALLPLPEAMALHAVTQMASNAWRGLLWRRHIAWRPVGGYVAGCLLAIGAWSLVRYVPDKPVALLALGGTPFLLRLVPAGVRPRPERRRDAAAVGVVCMSLMLLTGVSGPLLDSFFLGGAGLDRRQIVATKAACQVFGHALKLVWFGALTGGAAVPDPLLAGIAVGCSMLGTSLARRVLEAMSDARFRAWSARIVTAIAAFYLAQGAWLLALPWWGAAASR